jgi:hypothetical protein
MYADFLIFGLLIAFPITLTTKEALEEGSVPSSI